MRRTPVIAIGLICLAFGLGYSPVHAAGPTNVCGTLPATSIWSAADAPYVICATGLLSAHQFPPYDGQLRQDVYLMAATGAHMLSNGDSPAGPDVVSPRIYREFGAAI